MMHQLPEFSLEIVFAIAKPVFGAEIRQLYQESRSAADKYVTIKLGLTHSPP